VAAGSRIEGLLRLRRLAGERIRLTLVSPGEALVYRPLAVREPFSGGRAPRYPIERIAADTGTTWVKDQLAFVDLDARTVHTERGSQLSYDALLLAVGARETSPYEHAQVFNGRNGEETFHGIAQNLDAGRAERIAFVLPHGLAWPLPLYELALITAERARSVNVEPQLTFVTAEGRPLKAFGQAAGDAILRLLASTSSRSFWASRTFWSFLSERLDFDLADPLAGDVERPPDLDERARMLRPRR
jgi:sulfide:quinone oxidoreductase